MYRGMASAAVNQLEVELEYYQKVAKEQEEIIKQLHRGYPLPGEVTYIHPYDFAEILNNTSSSGVIDMYVLSSIGNDNICRVSGINYKQSPHMPQVTKNFK